MKYLLLLLLSILPGILLMWFFFRADRYEREPAGLVWKTFFLGAAVTIPTAILEKLLFYILGFSPFEDAGRGTAFLFISSVLCIGLVEEAAKLSAMSKAYRNKEFNEVMDGIVYGAAAAAGFATFENIFYVMSMGYQTGIVRAVLSVPGHIFYGAVIGFYLGLAKFSKRKRSLIILNGLIAAALFHGCYDFFLLTRNPAVALLAIPLVIYAFLTSKGYVKIALNISPFKVVTTEIPAIFMKKKPVGRDYIYLMKRASGWLMISFSAFFSICFSVLLFTSKEFSGLYGSITLYAYILFCVTPSVIGILLIVLSHRKAAGKKSH